MARYVIKQNLSDRKRYPLVLMREGRDPRINDDVSLPDMVGFAFDYRGNTTVVRRDESEIVGCVFDRNSDAPEPFIQFLDAQRDGLFSISYRDIAAIRFTVKDTGAGKRWRAWIECQE